MSKLHLEVLDKERLKIFNQLHLVDPKGVLTGGTALSLQIAHRRSVDFDFESEQTVKPHLLRKLNEVFREYRIDSKVDTPNELTVTLNDDFKITYFHFPYPRLYRPIKYKLLKICSVFDIASNKAHTIGRRGEWKDYVDIYFLIKKGGVSLEKIINDSENRFRGEFNEKLFLEQLVYWDDLHDFQIEFVEKTIPKEEIQKFFKKLIKSRLKK